MSTEQQTGPIAPRTISSSQTFFAKIIFPTFWIGGFATATVILFLAKPDPDTAFMKWIFLPGTMAGALMFWWIYMRLKRVRMDDKALYVSNYITEITVPLSNVAEVSGSRWMNNQQVSIRFHSETEFGSQIVFMPRLRFFSLWSLHPMVGEIRDAVARATGRGTVI
ncbi:MAG: hypothetical protein LAP21_25475 [Acidobacteriia bacterium]|nr:hypothetical protein [Terriglobia bacterium]